MPIAAGMLAACVMPPVFEASAQTHETSAQTHEASPGDQDDNGVMQALFVGDAVVLDGVLDEEVWQQAIAVSGFRQYEPVDGAPASQKTEVRVLYGSNNLYVGLEQPLRWGFAL